MAAAPIPSTWATTKDLLAHFQISQSHWSRLKSLWQQEGNMKQGRHYWKFSARTIRYDLDAPARLFHQQGKLFGTGAGASSPLAGSSRPSG